jgi:hypothetical protein
VTQAPNGQKGHVTRAWFDLLMSSQQTSQDMFLLVFYGRFLFKWGRGSDPDTVLRDDDGWLIGGWPYRQGGVVGNIGPPDLFWRNGIHYYYTRLSALSPLFDHLDNFAPGFGGGFRC